MTNRSNRYASLSRDELLMGEILVSLKRQPTTVSSASPAGPVATVTPLPATQSDAHAIVGQLVTMATMAPITAPTAHAPSSTYKAKVELSVQTPVEGSSFDMFSTISPVASSAYGNVLVAPSQSPSERSKRYGPAVQLEDLRKCFNMPIAAVARKFGICATLLKKICRRHGIQRWPHRQIRSLQKSIDMLRESLTVAKGSNKEYIAKKIAAFEYTLECIMKDPNTAAKGISAGRLASPASDEMAKRVSRVKASKKSSTVASAIAQSDDEDDEDLDHDDAMDGSCVGQEETKASMSLKSILC
ncbi:TPA: hypothetical protein N0F65_009278 [Lagenidium giganteum]|uniref:RWP-RK domain-containing protein n=1 Tax=Lagenidium giganteum TaxID=4803 RepID=A0AAV2YLU9_9STRA|nr:TPA: hypothetical protein N0F65_009278 [Lagenidium giganteum]